ncbi:Piso0_000521 [Millerozyma farinosa CBS 7064]|uniref:DNA 3'-5' helicase n=1 Tax=Pichia sorbitophila (strain ATCC MYA-4447 / BCRC 22081 / CBS 7064 / NBRC 10061 / NRRL Y-12695) TaxID=559304 RepID=G8YU78_PICSO|nr:Piso0_000521 [Millerozyma farinosa CBS 7064]CCE73479.1 Piso0_000521 [Millerozyma farinosa CBS 7064]
MSGIFDNTTEHQRRIIQHPADLNSILEVRAGPGSGKTSTLAKRIAYLVEHLGYKPDEILVLSMSNRAVKTLRERLRILQDGDLGEKISISTFHSFCGSLIDQYGLKYSSVYKRQMLMDDLSWRSFSKIFSGKTMSLNGKKIKGMLTAHSLESLLSDIRSGKLTVEQAAKVYKVNKEYIEELTEYLIQNGMIRYDDLLYYALNLMQDSQSSASNGKNPLISQLHNYKVIIVDEFQDIYPKLFDIITSIANYPTVDGNDTSIKHISVAGDPNQSIYDFLGTNPKIWDNLRSTFPNATFNVLKLDESFRNTPEILNSVYSIIDQSPSGVIKTDVKSLKQNGPLPTVYSCASAHKEYSFIAQEISRLILESGGVLKYSDFSVLMRTNKEIESFSNHVSKFHDLKVNKLSVALPWVTSRIHLMLDLLAVINGGLGSDFGLLCILSHVDTKAGNSVRLSKLFNLNQEYRDCRFSDKSSNSLESLISIGSLSRSQKISPEDSVFASKLESIYKSAKNHETLFSIYKVVSIIRKQRSVLLSEPSQEHPKNILCSLLYIMENSGLLEYLNYTDFTHNSGKLARNSSDVDMSSFLYDNIKSFYTSLCYSYECFQENKQEANKEDHFLEYFLRNYNDEVPLFEFDKVNIATIHAAKGMEFPVVFIVGLSEMMQPKSSWDPILLQDNARSNDFRLFYVAATRAKYLLYLGTSPYAMEHSKKLGNSFSRRKLAFSSLLSNNSILLENMCRDLKRPFPSNQAIASGSDVSRRLKFRNTSLLSQERYLHQNTPYRFYNLVRKCISKRLVSI